MEAQSKNIKTEEEAFDKKNFMLPEIQNNLLDKREKFAINLRKKKTKEIVIEKRRKIMQNF